MKNVGLISLAILTLAAPLLAGSYQHYGLQGSAAAINTSGQVAGTAASQAYLWSRTGGYQMLGTLGGGSSTATAINDSGAVAGNSTLPNGSIHAFLWTQTGGMQDLGSPLGGNSSAVAVNAVGEVAGITATPDGKTTHAFYWSVTTGAVDVGILPGDSASVSPVLNNAGEIAGISRGIFQTAFRWTLSGGIQTLFVSGSTGSAATAINDSGQIAGYFTDQGGNQHGALWAPDGTVQDLGLLIGDTFSYASFINAAGHIAGDSGHNIPKTPQTVYATFFWSPEDGMVYVDGYGDARMPYALNNRDEILGFGKASAPYVWSMLLGGHSVAIRHVYAIPGQFNDAGDFLAWQQVLPNIIYSVYSPAMLVSLTSSQNPSQSGQSVTFTANVDSIVGPPPDGEQIKFYNGGKLMGSATLSHGTASFTTTALSAGTHNIAARYAGDSNYIRSKSPVLQQVVNP